MAAADEETHLDVGVVRVGELERARHGKLAPRRLIVIRPDARATTAAHTQSGNRSIDVTREGEGEGE
jgi:hypothetical protein